MKELKALSFTIVFTLVYGLSAILYNSHKLVVSWSPVFTKLYQYEVQTVTIKSKSIGNDEIPKIPGGVKMGKLNKYVIPVTDTEFDYLCRVVWCEAGLEPFDGQVATASSVVNRVKSPLFPNTVTNVLYSPGQYSTVLTKKFQTCKPTAENIRAVRKALTSPTTGVLYFGRSPITHKGVFQIGHHYYSQ